MATVQIVLFTILIIAALILAGAATAVGGGVLLSARKRNALVAGDAPKLLNAGSSGLLERGFSDLRVGDVVMYDGRDFIVEGVIRYDEAGHHWSMARIVDGDSDQWLLVGLERSGASSKRLLAPNSEIELNGYPPEVIMVAEERYTFDKRGTATASLDGDTGTLGGNAAPTGGAAHRCRWWNYNGGSKSLLVEQWGDDYRVLVGVLVGDTDIEMMPGS